jgi:hypothetical protein
VLGGDSVNRVIDFSVPADSPNEVLAIVTRRADGGGGIGVLARSRNGGETFEELDHPLPEVDNFAVTVDTAPGHPERVYVSGLDQNNDGLLLVSDDGGETFDPRPIPGVTIDGPPFIAAVHPIFEDTVFVRTDGFDGDPFGGRMANDALFVTRDAGITWQELLRRGAKLYGFALSPDGTRVLAGFGDPRDVLIDDTALGIHSATLDADTVSAFTHETMEAVSCLKWTAMGLYVCATDFEVGFHLGFRADADLSGGLSSFTPLLELPNVKGPLACSEGTTGASCAEEWPVTCEAFQATCEVGSAGASAAGGAGAGAGSSGVGGAGGAESSGSSGSSPSDGCGCRIGARPALPALVHVLALLGAALLVVARRGRVRPHLRGHLGRRLRISRRRQVRCG